MRYANKNTSKGIRACSLVLSFLIMCSMLFVGQVGTIEASADTISAGTKIYIDTSKLSWWEDPSAVTAVYYENTRGEWKVILTEDEDDNTHSVTFPETINEFIVIRLNKNNGIFQLLKKDEGVQENPWEYDTTVDTIWNQTVNITVSSGNDLVVLADTMTSGKYNYSWSNYIPPVSIPADTTIYVEVGKDSSYWWGYQGAECGVICKTADGGYVYYNFTDMYDTKTESYQICKIYSFTTDQEIKSLIFVRFWQVSLPEDGSSVTFGTGEFTSGSGDVTYISGTNSMWTESTAATTYNYYYVYNNGSGNYGSKDENYTPPDDPDTYKTGTGNFYTANNGFLDSDGNSKIENVNLISATATFYDYYTDFEVANGWRSVVVNKDAEQASRTYENSFPFNNLNKYISNMAHTNDGWQLPLYFGNFFTGHSLSYTTDKQVICFGDDGYENVPSPADNYSSALYKFSTQANNSMFMRDANCAGQTDDEGLDASDQWSKGNTGDLIKGNYGDASKSFVGLVNSSLTNNNITMGSGEVNVSYFSDDIVNAGLATKVTTEFPMRVVQNTTDKVISYGTDGTKEYTSGDYDVYTFDSTNGTDNVYFTGYDSATDSLDTTGLTVNYAYESNKVNDALSGFGGTADGKGFFPFDTTGDAYDFGFGMKLEVLFNLGENGYINGTEEPMMFNFSGDDDVWVFIDGKLALDLGGDHKMATGSINFHSKKSIIDSGVYNPNDTDHSSNVYKNPETYNTGGLNYEFVSGTKYEADLSEIIDYSDPNKLHTMTIFYMERGMSESNLKMSFSVSPVSNRLTVEKSIDTGDVNTSLVNDVETGAASDNFNFTFSESQDNTNIPTEDYVYTKNGGKSTTALGEKATIQAGDSITFTDQFKVGNVVTVAESDSNNNYKYTQSFVVKDEYLELYPETGKNSEIAKGDSGTASFKYEKLSSVEQAPNLISVAYTNKVQVGNVTLQKILKEANDEDSNDNTLFSFTSTIKLPGEEIEQKKTFEYTDENGDKHTATDGKFTIRAGETIQISGLPVGTEITFTEAESDDYNTSISGGTVSSRSTTVKVETADATTEVVYTNTKVLQTVTLYFTATKQIGGESDKVNPDNGETFTFELQEVDSNGEDIENGKSLEATNSSATVTFESIKYETPISSGASEVHWYKITETTGNDNNYFYDNTVYYVKVTVTENGSELSATTEYYKNGMDSDHKIDNATSNNIVFYNQKCGTLTVNKTSTKEGDVDLSGTEFTLAVADGSNPVKPDENEIDSATKKTIGTNETSVTFENIAPGDYVLFESVAPKNHELDGTYYQVSVTVTGKVTVSGAETDKVTSNGTANVALEIENILSTDLPETGGIGVTIFVVLGIALVAAAIFLLKPKKQKPTTPPKGEEPSSAPPTD